ncbi:peptidase M52 [Streptomyces rimosus subsp. pseudoverticillatus]|uniref:hydrogenase maturation protease n=1 Tax=Streptomyces rimosus TaxID=1927 RepID=UPI0006B28E92|nr:hydrogenase maturation protease [Streptomyces rimosus]KOT86031.1 peptidase M52 [Streptomyces rimosus subsp. pseudoverticillatus]
MKAPPRIAVIGVGNTFRRDDGIGPAVVRRLRERAVERPLPPSVALVDCDGETGRLMTLWEGAELAIVIDAAHAHPGHPGRVHRFGLEGPYAGPAATSSHGLGLGEAIELSNVLGRLPDRLLVLAVEGADRSLGTGLTPAVAAVVDRLAATVEAEITLHRDVRARNAGHQAGGAPRSAGG